jgi:hypothetical protein
MINLNRKQFKHVYSKNQEVSPFLKSQEVNPFFKNPTARNNDFKIVTQKPTKKNH